MSRDRPLEITLRHEGRCIVCDGAMAIGEPALWQQGPPRLVRGPDNKMVVKRSGRIAHPWHFTIAQRETENLLDRFVK